MVSWCISYGRRNTQSLLWLVLIGIFVVGSLSAIYGFRRAFLAGTLLFLSVVAHETAHALTSAAFGCPVKAVRCSAMGPHIVRTYSGSTYVELAVAAAGPTVNLVLCLCFVTSSSPILRWTALANLVLATVNLLPLKNSDGSRVISALSVIVQGREQVHP